MSNKQTARSENDSARYGKIAMISGLVTFACFLGIEYLPDRWGYGLIPIAAIGFIFLFIFGLSAILEDIFN